MERLAALFVLLQAAGALFGAFAAAAGELAYLRALHAGEPARGERAHLDHLARGLRFGMTLILLASFGLAMLAYLARAAAQPAFTAGYWTLTLLALALIWVSWALSRGRIWRPLGAAVAFTAWWFLAYLALGFFPQISFGAALALFVVSTAVFYALLGYLRHFAASAPHAPAP